MQIMQDANNKNDSLEYYASQAAQFIKEIADLHFHVISPPPDEIHRVLQRLKDAQTNDKQQKISSSAAYRQMITTLYHNPGLTMGEISQSLSIPLYTATRIIDSLVDNEIAERQSDPDDRRIVRVTLTEDGRLLHEVLESHIINSFKTIMACLTPEEQNVLVSLFSKMSASLKRE
jgi:DNA-binding MarR family transcriptional regulator